MSFKTSVSFSCSSRSGRLYMSCTGGSGVCIEIFGRNRTIAVPDSGNHNITSCLRTKTLPHSIEVLDVGASAGEATNVFKGEELNFSFYLLDSHRGGWSELFDSSRPTLNCQVQSPKDASIAASLASSASFCAFSTEFSSFSSFVASITRLIRLP